MKTKINFNRIENNTIGLIQSNLNRLTDIQRFKLRQKRLMNLTQSEINIIKKYKKVS